MGRPEGAALGRGSRREGRILRGGELPLREGCGAVEWDLLPTPTPRRQFRVRLFFHLTFPPPGQLAPTLLLQVIVSPTGMPRREVPTLSQDVAGPSCILHTQLKKSTGSFSEMDFPRGGCQPASSAPRASQVCE